MLVKEYETETKASRPKLLNLIILRNIGSKKESVAFLSECLVHVELGFKAQEALETKPLSLSQEPFICCYKYILSRSSSFEYIPISCIIVFSIISKVFARCSFTIHNLSQSSLLFLAYFKKTPPL